MTDSHKTLLILLGTVVTMRLLQKPVTRAVFSIFTGPKWYAAIKDDIASNDPVRIQKLHDAYDKWPVDIQSQFNDTIRNLGLKRPW